MADQADTWSLVFDHCARDEKGMYAVPALALVSKYYRAVSTEARRGAAQFVTPYDAVITFVPNGRTRVPVSFYGGVHFASARFGEGLSIIRDASTGQMFAVSHPPAHHTGAHTPDGKRIEEYVVNRMFPLARLAQLLSGHESNPFLRLASLNPYRMSSRFWFRNVPLATGNTVKNGIYGVMTKNQMRSTSWTGEPGPLEVHYEDFISQRLVRSGGPGMTIGLGGFVLSTTENSHKRASNWHSVVSLDEYSSWYGPDCAVLTNDNLHPDDFHVHVLCRALGHNCDPVVAEGPGWLVSLLTHGDPELPTKLIGYSCAVNNDDEIAAMCELARERRRKAEMAKARPYHPIHNPTGYMPTKKRGMAQRAKRSAAVVAQARMQQAGMEPLTPAPKRAAIEIDLTDDEPAEAAPPRDETIGPERRRTRHSAVPPEPDRVLTAAEAMENFYAYVMSL